MLAAKNGDKDAAETLIKNNSPLIKSVIRRYRNRGIDYDDLFQLGSIGFIKAVKNFSTEFNVRFSTYAVPMILGEVKRFLRDDGLIKVSRSTKTLAIKIAVYVDAYKSKYNSSPTLEDIAKEFSITPQDAVFIMDSSLYPLSISDKGEDDKGQSLLEKLPCVDDGDEQIDKMVLKDIIQTLDDRERKIIILRYFKDKTQSEVARVLNVSQVQISRLENKILEKMRADLKKA